MTAHHDILIAIPCYNEAERLDRSELLRLASHPGIRLLFVNDGSTDRTAEVLQTLATSAPDDIEILSLERNLGKAEAVRSGLLRSLDLGFKITGYVDADLATPVDEIIRLAHDAVGSRAAVTMGSRVRLLGRRIERSPRRHYLGRIFATAASIVLQLKVYDTQCGAKFFRNTESLRAALSTPFKNRWIFDVELIHRLLRGSAGVPPLLANDFLEVPLLDWREVSGSKLKAGAMLRSALGLVSLAFVARYSRHEAARPSRRVGGDLSRSSASLVPLRRGESDKWRP